MVKHRKETMARNTDEGNSSRKVEAGATCLSPATAAVSIYRLCT